MTTAEATITIPLGILDAYAHVYEDGTVLLGGHEGYPLPRALSSAAWTVLSTWMVEQESATEGATAIPVDGWWELFGSRLRERGSVPA